jgi:signal transduction histidine kinase
MRLSQFIQGHIEPILAEWEAFARTLMPPAATMSVAELRDHAHDILLAIAQDMDTAQDTFLAVLGHDLRNPLSAPGSCVQILGLTDEPIRKDKTPQLVPVPFRTLSLHNRA